MIDRENLTYIKNILSLHNNFIDLDSVYEILSAVKEGDEFSFYTSLLKYTNPELDIKLLNSVLKTAKHNQQLKDDIFDSYSSNQFASKSALLNTINSLNILNKNSTIFIWGCWYGSILVPALADKVKKIIALDLDETAIQTGKKFFDNYKNVEFQCEDVFKKYLNSYKEADLIVNTSCEHMPPMKEWKWFQKGAIETDSPLKHKFSSPKLSSNCYFAFQSNNMFGIEGHVNCVNSLEEFKEQLPERAKVLFQEEVKDTRGTRYMLVGKFNPL